MPRSHAAPRAVTALALALLLALAHLAGGTQNASAAPHEPGAAPSEATPLAPITAERDAGFAVRTPAVEVESASAARGGYAFDVRLTGHQEALDLCAGWVFEDFMAGDVVSSHNHCGGDVVLGLEVGDAVALTGYAEGRYTVTQLKTVPRYSPATVLEGGLWMQTCLWDSDLMRLARLSPA
ncbi:hypothetical protein [Demequina phytophila]|uniref:hypothetical protein n=1 Tax=Demequina phytophila TaxID=1638981 RepID=UPI000784240D|nr:hypothetical protein [Demequina phytophila]